MISTSHARGAAGEAGRNGISLPGPGIIASTRKLAAFPRSPRRRGAGARQEPGKLERVAQAMIAPYQHVLALEWLTVPDPAKMIRQVQSRERPDRVA